MGSQPTDWVSDLPNPLSIQSTRVAETAVELPEVRALVALGWTIVPDGAIARLLPALWPGESRTWVHDRSTRYVRITTASGSYFERWSDADCAEAWDSHVDYCRNAGISEPQPDRIWLLKFPAGLTLEAFLERVGHEYEAQSSSGAKTVVRVIRGRIAIEFGVPTASD